MSDQLAAGEREPDEHLPSAVRSPIARRAQRQVEVPPRIAVHSSGFVPLGQAEVRIYGVAVTRAPDEPGVGPLGSGIVVQQPGKRGHAEPGSPVGGLAGNPR
jgi:hypothetical protein